MYLSGACTEANGYMTPAQTDAFNNSMISGSGSTNYNGGNSNTGNLDTATEDFLVNEGNNTDLGTIDPLPGVMELL